jgi:ribonuclease/clavin/mitogillin
MRDAASVILCRSPSPEDLEVFLVERSPELAFFGGYQAFPGGAVEAGDAELPLAGAEKLDSGERRLVACAARELLEETGVAIAAGTAGFDAGAFTPAARLVTPSFAATSFDTRFYLVEIDRRIEPRVVPAELKSGAWWRPAEALAAWRRGDLLITPPALLILEQLSKQPLPSALAALRAVPARFEGSGRAIPWTPGIEIVPLHSPPLPASIPTNVFLAGCRRFVLIDPAPAGAAEQEHLFEAVERRLAAGDRLEAVVLSHHHADHIGALDAATSRFGAPLWAHRITGELLGRRLDRELDDGEWMDLGPGPNGRAGWGLRVLFTPGHAGGHLAFHDERYGALLAGDLVSTLVTMYVGSPGGHLETYFRSLARLRALPIKVLYPSHGAPTLRAERVLAETEAHRRRRIDQVAEALAETPQEAEELAAQVYRGADPRLQPLFVRVTRAALEHLVENGRAVRQGADAFARAAASTHPSAEQPAGS